MTTIRVEVDEEVARRLAARAEQRGVTAEELAGRALADYVGRATENDGLSFVGIGESAVLRAERADELLAEGFGR